MQRGVRQQMHPEQPMKVLLTPGIKNHLRSEQPQREEPHHQRQPSCLCHPCGRYPCDLSLYDIHEQSPSTNTMFYFILIYRLDRNKSFTEFTKTIHRLPDLVLRWGCHRSQQGIFHGLPINKTYLGLAIAYIVSCQPLCREY